jgi:hypothetical protein
MKHERETLEAVIQARNQAEQIREQIGNAIGDPQAMAQLGQAEGALGGLLGRLFALSEAYPDLKASENFPQFQEELTSTENRVAYARQAYNDAGMNYNNAVESVPSNFVAGGLRLQACRHAGVRGPRDHSGSARRVVHLIGGNSAMMLSSTFVPSRSARAAHTAARDLLRRHGGRDRPRSGRAAGGPVVARRADGGRIVLDPSLVMPAGRRSPCRRHLRVALVRIVSFGGDGARVAQALGAEEVTVGYGESVQAALSQRDRRDGHRRRAAAPARLRHQARKGHQRLRRRQRPSARRSASPMARWPSSTARNWPAWWPTRWPISPISTPAQHAADGHGVRAGRALHARRGVMRSFIFMPRRRDNRSGPVALAIGVGLIVLGLLGVLAGASCRARCRASASIWPTRPACSSPATRQGWPTPEEDRRDQAGSHMGNAHAEEARHMFFANATGSLAGAVRHPPAAHRAPSARSNRSATIRPLPGPPRCMMRGAADPWAASQGR